MHDDERAVHAWLKRTGDTARTLGNQWVELADHVGPGGGGGGSDRRATVVHAAPPLRVEVVALRDDIAAMAARYAPLVRGTLRMGVGPSVSTVADRLRFIGGSLPRLHDEDEALCTEVADHIWRLHRKAANVMDPHQPRRRPFRIDDLCPDCGEASLWVDPAHWRIGCGMPECRGIWGIDQPILTAAVRG